MKVGLITHHWVPNFGANIQAYASVNALQDRGLEVKVLNFRPQALEEKYARSVDPQQREVHEQFCTKYFDQTAVLRDQADFVSHVSEESYDLLISGSDAVFRLAPETGRADYVFPNPYWLDLPSPSPKRAAISVSAMGDYYRTLADSMKRDITTVIESLDYVATRDYWTSSELKKCGVQRNVLKTPDPVFYLREMIEEMSGTRDERYIAMSASNWFGDEWNSQFKDIANKNGYKVVGLPTPEGHYDTAVDEKVELPLDPLEWVKHIARSSGYIGARYHPVVVALLGKVPILSTDKYHYSFWDAKRSKNVDLMIEFDMRKYCIGGLKKKFLSPNKAFAMLEQQQSDLGTVRTTAVEWNERFSQELDTIIAMAR